MRNHFYIEEKLGGWWIAHRAVGPINSAPESRSKERRAFFNIYRCGRQLAKIDDYDEKLGYDLNYLENTFNQIDSLAYEIHKSFMVLERYQATHVKNSDLRTLNNIHDSEYIIENY